MQSHFWSSCMSTHCSLSLLEHKLPWQGEGAKSVLYPAVLVHNHSPTIEALLTLEASMVATSTRVERTASDDSLPSGLFVDRRDRPMPMSTARTVPLGSMRPWKRSHSHDDAAPDILCRTGSGDSQFSQVSALEMERQASTWVCRHCTYKNVDFYHGRCAVCGTTADFCRSHSTASTSVTSCRSRSPSPTHQNEIRTQEKFETTRAKLFLPNEEETKVSAHPINHPDVTVEEGMTRSSINTVSLRPSHEIKPTKKFARRNSAGIGTEKPSSRRGPLNWLRSKEKASVSTHRQPESSAFSFAHRSRRRASASAITTPPHCLA